MTALLLAMASLTAAATALLLRPLWVSVPGVGPVRKARRAAVILAALIAASAASIYAGFGQPRKVWTAPPAQTDHAPDLAQSMASLAARLELEPDNGLGWMTLARARFEFGLHAEAVQAYARAHRLLGDEPQLLAEYAEALALRHDGVFTPNARTLLARALYLQPRNAHALWLAGLAAYAGGDAASAVESWKKALAEVPRGGAEARRLTRALRAAGAGGRD